MANKGKKQTKIKPRRTSKPLSARKSVQEANRKMMEFFSGRLMELQKAMAEMEKRIAESNQQLWNNQQQQNKGLGIAEEHVVLIRRVLNDALGGVTRVTKIERRSQSDPEKQEEAQVIDWGWYGEQLHYSESPEVFMNGVVLTEDEVKERAEKERVKRRHNIVLYLAGKAAEADEPKLKEAYDAGGLDELLKKFLPQKVEWEEEMHDIAPEIVAAVLRQRDINRKQQQRLAEAKERGLLKMAVQRIIAGGDEELLKDPEQREELVHEALPNAMNWTPRMAEALESVIEECFEEAEAKAKENDPEEVEAAKQELLEKTKQFGDKAAEVIQLIEAGEEEEARKKMAELEERVKAEEALAQQNAPHVPDGAAIFGG